MSVEIEKNVPVPTQRGKLGAGRQRSHGGWWPWRTAKRRRLAVMRPGLRTAATVGPQGQITNDC